MKDHDDSTDLSLTSHGPNRPKDLYEPMSKTSPEAKQAAAWKLIKGPQVTGDSWDVYEDGKRIAFDCFKDDVEPLVERHNAATAKSGEEHGKDIRAAYDQGYADGKEQLAHQQPSAQGKKLDAGDILQRYHEPRER